MKNGDVGENRLSLPAYDSTGSSVSALPTCGNIVAEYALSRFLRMASELRLRAKISQLLFGTLSKVIRKLY